MRLAAALAAAVALALAGLATPGAAAPAAVSALRDADSLARSAPDSLAAPAAAAESDTAATDSTVRPAPDFMLPDLDGVPRRFLAVKGRVVLLVYWSPECPECLHDLPRLARLYARDRDRGLAVVSVTYPRMRAEAAAYAKDKALGFPVLLDTGGQVAKLYRVRITPTVFVVRDGRVVLSHAGFDPNVADPVEPAVEALLR